MITKVRSFYKQLGVEPYWYVIAFFLLVAAVLFVQHLITGFTPDPVIVSPLNFDIYWYSVCIVGGIAIGAYVVSRLALKRGESLFRMIVPNAIRRKSLTSLDLPDEIVVVMAKRRIQTLGELLLQWGFDPRNLGLNEEGIELVQSRLEGAPGVKSEWVVDAPWRVWNPDHVWNGVVWSLVLGVIGARLYHVLTPSPSMASLGIESPLDYLRHPYQLINLRSGGLGIYGGIIGGALGLIWYTRRQRLPTLEWTDIAGIGMALGQVFGRWGNFFNQELYGRPTNLPWGILIEAEHRVPGFGDMAAFPPTTKFHPAFLYESLWSLLAFVVLLTLFRRRRQKLLTGDLTALYLIFYAVGRILLETVRLDSRMVALGDTTLNIAVATLVSLITVVVMVAWRAYPRLLRTKDD